MMKSALVVVLVLYVCSVQSLEIKSSVSETKKRFQHTKQRVHKHVHAKPHTTFGLKKKVKNPIVVPIKPQHNAQKTNLVRFRAKKVQVTGQEADTSSAEGVKLHIADKEPKGLQLTASESQVGTTSELQVQTETEAKADYSQADQLATYSGGAYSAGLGDEAQASATIEDEMANQLKTISDALSDETNRATKAEDQVKTDYTAEIQKNKQERLAAEKDLDAAISKEQNARKEADDTRAKSENDVTQNLNDQISKLNDKVSQCSQNVQKAVQKANSLQSIVNAFSDKHGGGTKIAFLQQNEHINHLHRLHLQFEKMQAKHGF